MAVLILAELNGNDLSEDATSKAVSAAKGLGDIHVLCASSNCSGAATSAAKLNGVSKVLCVNSEVFGNGMAEPIADLVVSMSGDYEHMMAPDIPTATYKSGATTLPVCPTCQSLGAYPLSTAALDAPTAAPNLSASFSIIAKSASEPTPLPPDTTAPADVNSGLSEAATLSSIHTDREEATLESIFSIEALPDASTASKLAVRTETIFL